jgi:hypothetical protein
MLEAGRKDTEGEERRGKYEPEGGKGKRKRARATLRARSAIVRGNGSRFGNDKWERKYEKAESPASWLDEPWCVVMVRHGHCAITII